jgi:hypothetical protein
MNLKIFLFIPILALAVIGCKKAENHITGEEEWSKPVNGLSARLLILPAKESHSPFCRILIEMQNVSDVLGQKKIRFNPDKLALYVKDKNGKLLPIAIEPYDGISPLWEPTLLPYFGTIRFEISFPGLGHSDTDKVIVDVGPTKAWIIPQDGSTYWLSGTLTIEKQKSDHPSTDWSGTLELPGVEIPKCKK